MEFSYSYFYTFAFPSVTCQSVFGEKRILLFLCFVTYSAFSTLFVLETRFVEPQLSVCCNCFPFLSDKKYKLYSVTDLSWWWWCFFLSLLRCEWVETVKLDVKRNHQLTLTSLKCIHHTHTCTVTRTQIQMCAKYNVLRPWQNEGRSKDTLLVSSAFENPGEDYHKYHMKRAIRQAWLSFSLQACGSPNFVVIHETSHIVNAHNQSKRWLSGTEPSSVSYLWFSFLNKCMLTMT